VVLQGQNSKSVIERVKQTLAGMRNYLPAGVSIEPFYDQSTVIDGTIRTVRSNLLEGGLLVIAILFFALGDIRAAAIVATVIPLSMLGAFIGMQVFGISANLMSLGAVDFGVVIAGAVVIAENAVRRMQHGAVAGGESRLDTIRAATHEVSVPTLSGIAILLLVYLPILTLEGLEGRMFRPMAVTVCSAVVVSLFLALFVVPTACRYFLRVNESDSRRYHALERLEGVYRSILGRVLQHPYLAAATAVLLVGSAVGSLGAIGTEFMPRLDEGSLLIETRKIPSVSLSESVRLQEQVEDSLKEIPEITSVISKMGRPDFATEAMGVYQADVYVGFKPMEDWTSAASKEEMIEVISQKLDTVPGVLYNFTQPMEMRLNETVAGVRADVALKIFGDDEVELERLADVALDEISQIRGAADVMTRTLHPAAVAC
jgi:cobalt-zinc-cadmium resistance protein CzcA